MRALLLYNPNATTTTTAVTDAIATQLSSQMKLEVVATKRRHHAGFLAAGAVHEGYETIFALGGDGTVNEVMQGVARTPVKLGIIPGGSANVWARTLGLPPDPLAATTVLLEKLRNDEERTVNLGSANGRYFGFTAGYGYDAAVVRAVERRPRLKRTLRQGSFLWCGVVAYLWEFERKAAHISIAVDDVPTAEGLRSVVCCNSNPWTYLGRWPAQLCPDAQLDGALDVTALTGLSLPRLLKLTRTALTSTDVPQLRDVRTWHDRERYELRNDVPLPLEVDGDFVCDTTAVVLETVPAALTLVA